MRQQQNSGQSSEPSPSGSCRAASALEQKLTRPLSISTDSLHKVRGAAAASSIPCSATTSDDAMAFLCSLASRYDNPEALSLALDALCTCEASISAVVREAQKSVASGAAAARAAAERERRAAPTIERACAELGTPFWITVVGPLRLVRSDHTLKSPEVRRLERGAQVLVHACRKHDGVWRGLISLCGGAERGAPGHRVGWMTLVPKDGTENTAFMVPQPPLPLEDDSEVDGSTTRGSLLLSARGFDHSAYVA